ncbi:MAG: rRNA maturation RNase YbeY [Mariprofundaceae bacterium]|nr:rRNA maturation RNase YbeY [Mariprofundaceae bacterium]
MTGLEIIVDDDVEGDEPRSTEWVQAIEHTVKQALQTIAMPQMMATPLCLSIASNATVQQLNNEWRHKDAVTDVLSFPMQDAPDFDPHIPLGDIVVALPFVADEAQRLGLPLLDHLLHLLVHGVLHLLGYDHIDDDDAQEMQALERRCMAALSLHDPYPTDV